MFHKLSGAWLLVFVAQSVAKHLKHNSVKHVIVTSEGALQLPVENSTGGSLVDEIKEDEKKPFDEYIDGIRPNLIIALSLWALLIVLLTIWYSAMRYQKRCEGKEEQRSVREEVAGVGLVAEDPESEDAIEGYIFIKTVDTKLADMCQNPSIYLIMWAARGPALDTSFAFLVSLGLQTVVPLLLFPLAGSDHFWVGKKLPNKIVAVAFPFILVYTFLTLKTAGDRVIVWLTLIGGSGNCSTTTSWAEKLPLVTGCLVVTCCICFTLLSTVHLFLQDPTIQAMLLNSVAVNFLPTIDTTLTDALGALTLHSSKMKLLASNRLQKLGEVWQESTDRKDLIDWCAQPMISRCWRKPCLFMAWFFYRTLLTAALLGCIVLGIIQAIIVRNVSA